MAGHSKWAKIKRQKAVVDVKRGAVYAKMAREIIVATRLGGPDPAANFRLRHAIERAKAEGVPNDNIDRAIEKGSGTGAGDDVEELVYEGYGPGGVAILVKCATDNRNRTAGDIRYFFTKHGGNLGENGCVAWMFKERGEVTVEKGDGFDEDSLLLSAGEAGADDILSDDDEQVLVVCSPDKVVDVKQAIEAAEHKVSSAEVTMSPMSTVEVTEEQLARQLLKLIDALENQDDVQDVFANFEMDDNWIAEFMG